MKKRKINKRIIVSCLLAFLITFQCDLGMVFADGDNISPSASSDFELSQDELDFLNNASSNDDVLIRTIALAASRSTGDPVTDIYNILDSVWGTSSIAAAYAIRVDSPDIDDKLVDMYTLFANNFRVTSQSDGSSDGLDWTFGHGIWFICQEILAITKQLAGDPNQGITGINQYVSDIYSSIMSTGGLHDLISQELSKLTDIYTKLYTNTGASVADLLNDIKQNTFYDKYNTGHIDQDLHEIKQWLDDTFYFTTNDIISFPDSYAMYQNVGSQINMLSYPVQYRQGITPYYLSYIFNLDNIDTSDITVYCSSPSSWELNSLAGNRYYYFNLDDNNIVTDRKFVKASFDYSINDEILSITFHLDHTLGYKYLNFMNYNGQYCFKPIGNNEFTISPYTLSSKKNNYIEHIDSDLHNQIDILNTFKELYASDDLIAAKQAQQQYEDQAIQDFTGNGSAAASSSDLNDLKQISGTVSSGLDSGGSVSNGLSVFDPNYQDINGNRFWDWFSQDNYNNINNPNLNNRRSSSQDEIIDFYNQNQNEVLRLLGGENR